MLQLDRFLLQNTNLWISTAATEQEITMGPALEDTKKNL